MVMVRVRVRVRVRGLGLGLGLAGVRVRGLLATTHEQLADAQQQPARGLAVCADVALVAPGVTHG